MTTHYLACDLGAESGRLMLGTLGDGRLALEEIHRFANVPLRTSDGLFWDVGSLFDELKAGLKRAVARGVPVSGISTDSWGLDYMLFTAEGTVLPPAFHYRDSRTARGVENALAKVAWKTIFAETGIQFLPMNTIFQFAAEKPGRLRSAALALGIGDGFNYLLSGVARAEESLASTFQLYDPRTRQWSPLLLEALDLRPGLLPEIIPSGTRLGPLKQELAAECGLAGLEVIASCSHDTGAAVAAVPARGGEPWAYISSGTWSLMGVERREPVLNDTCRELNFTNEIGFGASVRLLKNIIGLWLVQECRRQWAREGREFDYATLTRLAAEARPFVSLIDPTDARFLNPENMPETIATFCRETGQPAPETPGAVIRCALESLALQYRRTLLELGRVTGGKVNRVFVVGGGSKNRLLNQFTAGALNLPVSAGPAEATSIGNILIQAIALGHVASLDAARQIVRESFPAEEYQPADAAEWCAAFERFETLGRKSA